MDARVSDFFGSENGHGSGSQGAASNAKSGNGYGVSQRKAFLKSKKSKTRFARNLKPSNNTPYLPPEVSMAKKQIKTLRLSASSVYLSCQGISCT